MLLTGSTSSFMRIAFDLAKAHSLKEVADLVTARLRHVRQDADRLVYVAGIVSSDGPEQIATNLRSLHQNATYVAERFSAPTFSAADVFSPDVYARVGLETRTNAEFCHFWTAVLRSGFVTDIVLTPRWRTSAGARSEYAVARRRGLRLHSLRASGQIAELARTTRASGASYTLLRSPAPPPLDSAVRSQ